MTGLVIAVGVSLVVSFICSLSEASLLSVTRIQAQALGDRFAGRTLRRYKREIDVPIAAILSANTAANTLGAAVAGAEYAKLFGDQGVLAFSGVLTVVILLFSEILPKTVGAVHPARFIVPVVYFVAPLVFVLKPFIAVTRLAMRAIRGVDVPVTSLEEIRLLAELGKSEGALAERTAKMIEGAARLKELTAYDVMVPRTAAVLLSGKKTLRENLNIVRRSGYSRFPYSRTGQADGVDGIVLARDLLFALQGEGAGPEKGELPRIDLDEPAGPLLDALTRPADYVPEQTLIEDLLHKFQEKRNHLAVVVDEYGGVGGIVTLEDVLEEIVGEIQDESDRHDNFIVQRGEGVLVCRGRAETRKVFGLLGIEAEVESVTVGGLMAEELGRLPVVGDTIRFGGYQFSVQRATARRVDRVLVRPASSSQAPT
jgi:CBS domain containing-hemolysin-like protein